MTSVIMERVGWGGRGAGCPCGVSTEQRGSCCSQHVDNDGW